MACRLVGLSRSAYRRPLKGDTVTDPDRALREWLRAWAKDHPRYGEGIARVTSARVNTALRRHGVRLLIVDDVHMLRLTERSGRQVLD
ncbi:hypothetical protein GCM10022275_27880 [Tessaracoccus defluvii]